MNNPGPTAVLRVIAWILLAGSFLVALIIFANADDSVNEIGMPEDQVDWSRVGVGLGVIAQGLLAWSLLLVTAAISENVVHVSRELSDMGARVRTIDSRLARTFDSSPAASPSSDAALSRPEQARDPLASLAIYEGETVLEETEFFFGVQWGKAPDGGILIRQEEGDWMVYEPGRTSYVPPSGFQGTD